MPHVPSTNPYPWPFDGRLDARRFAVVVLGAQRGFVAASHDTADVSEAIAAVTRAVRAGGGLVVWVRHARVSGPTAGPCAALPARASDEWQPASLPDPADPADRVVDAFGWDGCFGSPLDTVLRSHGVTCLALAGYASELTVDSTVRTLNDRGHECLVVTDACAPLDPGLGARAQASLTMSGGIFGALGTSAHLIGAITSPYRRT